MSFIDRVREKYGRVTASAVGKGLEKLDDEIKEQIDDIQIDIVVDYWQSMPENYRHGEQISTQREDVKNYTLKMFYPSYIMQESL